MQVRKGDKVRVRPLPDAPVPIRKLAGRVGVVIGFLRIPDNEQVVVRFPEDGSTAQLPPHSLERMEDQ